MVKPKKFKDDIKSSDEMMIEIVKKKTDKIDNALQKLQTLAMQNSYSMPQIRSSADSVPFDDGETRSSLILQRSTHTLAKFNARRNK